MAHGNIHLKRHGTVHGTRHGSLTLAGGMSSVTRDSTSLIYCPANASEWTTTLGVAGISSGGPGFLWLCQEASGSLADTIGGVSLAPNNAPSYQQAVTGWTRLCVKMTDGTANQRFSSTSASLPDVSATSALLLAYVGFTGAPAAVRGVMAMGTATTSDARHNTVAPRLVSGANTANGASTLSTQVRPWVMQINVGTSNNELFTDQEHITPTFGTPTGKQIQLGGTGAVAANAQYLYAALFTGTAAQLSDAQIKTLLQTLGWTIPWV